MSAALDERGVRKRTSPYSRGMIVGFSGTVIPAGFALCDGTNGTPDLRNRFIVGDTAVGAGSAGGSHAITASITHAGMTLGAHSAHSVGQPTAHPNHVVGEPATHSTHVVGQPGAHSDHISAGSHSHDAHTNGSTVDIDIGYADEPNTHAAQVGHTHDSHSAHSGASLSSGHDHSGSGLTAHSAHSGTALDAHSAHSVTQPDAHGVLKHYLLAFIMWRGLYE